ALASIQPTRRFPSVGSVTPSQRLPRAFTTPSVRGEPNGVVPATRSTTGPNGRLRTATAPPAWTWTIRCAGRGTSRRTQPSPPPVSERRPEAGEEMAAPVLARASTSDENARIRRPTQLGSARRPSYDVPRTSDGSAEPLLDPLQRGHHVLDRRLRLRLRVEGTLGLEVDALDVVELHSLASQRRDQLLPRHQLVAEIRLDHLPVLVERSGRSLHHPPEARMTEDLARQQVVRGDQDRGAEEA